jgi:hypothetical protein
VPLQDPDTGAPQTPTENPWAEVRRETGRGKDQLKIRDLFADERCSQAILDFLATTDLGRLAPKPAEEDAPSEALAWELQERNEREEE